MKRIIAVLLIFLITITGVLYSCSSQSGNDSPTVDKIDKNNEGDEASGPVTPNNEETNDTVAVETVKIFPDLPEKDLNDETFTFYVMGYERNVNNYSVEIYAEAENGDVINDAVYRRNKTVEEKYNFTVAEFPEKNSSLADSVKKTLLAGDDLYQVFMMNLRDSASLANQGFLQNLKNVENLDLSKQWWDSKSNDGLSICSKLYFAVGDINIMDNNATWAVFFNKKLIKDLGLEMPYTYVQNNEWTLDKYHEMSAAAAKDLNGDGLMNPDDDCWGTVGDYMNTFMLYIASGEKAIKKDAADIPYLESINERGANVMDKVLDIQLDSNSTLHANEYSSKYANVYSDMLRRNFKEDRALFYIAGLLSYTLLRDMESEFGMVPMPKYDSAQDSYYTTYNYGNASSLSIPVTNSRLSDTGLIVEALAAESMYTLTPAYYTVALERKYMRDEESRAMLDIILSSRIVDLDIIFNWGGSYDMFEQVTQKKSRDFTSEFEKIKGKAESEIAKTVEAFTMLN